MRQCVWTALGCWIILGVACSRHGSRSGEPILSQDTMKSVLWDVLKADAYNDTRTFNDSNFRHDTTYAAMYLSVFNAHHVSWEQFMDSYDYYMTQPELLRSIIDSMSEKANRDLRKRGIAPSGNGNPAFRNNFPGTPGHPNFPQGQNGRPFTSPGHPGPPFNMTRRPGFTAPTLGKPSARDTIHHPY